MLVHIVDHDDIVFPSDEHDMIAIIILCEKIIAKTSTCSHGGFPLFLSLDETLVVTMWECLSLFL